MNIRLFTNLKLKIFAYFLTTIFLVACGDENPSDSFIFQVECYSGEQIIYGPVYVKELKKTDIGVWELKNLNDEWSTIFGECYLTN